MADENTKDDQTAAREASVSAPICSALRWTRNRPKVPGWYWLAAPVGYTPRIVKVWRNDDDKLYVNAETPGWMLDKRGAWKGCRWAGPILPPND